VLPRDRQRLAEPARPARQQAQVFEPSARLHLLDAVGRLERAHQHGARDAFTVADEVQTPVDPVRPVDVRVPGRTEHRGIAPGEAAVGVARRVLAVVGLDLDDPPAHAVDQQRRADQLGRHLVHAAGEIHASGSRAS
jgi:hypothetical protein